MPPTKRDIDDDRLATARAGEPNPILLPEGHPMRRAKDPHIATRSPFALSNAVCQDAATPLPPPSHESHAARLAALSRTNRITATRDRAAYVRSALLWAAFGFVAGIALVG